MNRIMQVYVWSLVGLLLVAVTAIRFSQVSGLSGAVSKLGKGEKEFQEARQTLLLGVADPVPTLCRAAQDKKESIRARVQALRILQELTYHQDLHSLGQKIVPLLDDSSVELRKEALGTLSMFGSLAGLPRIKRMLFEETDTGLVIAALSTLASGADHLAGETQDAMQTGDSARLDSCLAAFDSLPIGRAGIFPSVGRYFKVRGDIERGGSYVRRLGIIRKWWLIGTFENRQMKGFLQPLGPETDLFDPTASYAVDETTSIHWRRLDNPDMDQSGMIYLANLFVQQIYTVVYFFTYVHSPTERQALLHTGSDDGMRIWVNDSLVYSSIPWRAGFPDTDCNRILLRKGANKLLIKVVQDLGGWNMCCRLTDLAGEAMDDVVVSLEPELAPSPLADLLDRAQKSFDAAQREIDSLDYNDEYLISSVIREVADQANTAERRLAALKILDRMNDGRLVPAGELDLLHLAGKELENGGTGPILGEIVDMLLSMNTSKGLELGGKFRSAHEPHVALMGNRLISLYCKNRLAALGDLRDPERRIEIERTIHDLERLDPTDAWVLERVAAFYDVLGESEKASSLKARLAMPGRWLLKTSVGFDMDSKNPRSFCSAGFDLDKAWQKEGNEWKRVEAEGTAPVYIDIPGKLLAPSDKKHSVLCTQVKADRADSIVMLVSIPAVHGVWVNDRFQRTRPPYRSFGMDGLHIRYHWQPRLFDLGYHPVRLRRGLNTIQIVFGNSWIPRVKQRYFRCAFADLRGNPLSCKDGVLALPAGETL
jgi:hypothetical protein